MIGKLYLLEDDYKRNHLSPEEIYKRRNDAKTEEVVEKLRNRLYDLLANKSEINSDLMLRALNYLHTFWAQILAYRNDGEYSIDNMAAERAIRPTACSSVVSKESRTRQCSTPLSRLVSSWGSRSGITSAV